MSFSKRLKTAMAEREISQAELAALIGKGKSVHFRKECSKG